MHPFLSAIVRKIRGHSGHEWDLIKPIRDITDVNTCIHRYIIILSLLVVVLLVQEFSLRRMCPVVGMRVPNEQSPLLNARIPRDTESNSLATILIVGCLILVLASGAFIGTYLLLSQRPSQVPPVLVPPFVARNVWQKGKVIKLNSLSNTPGIVSDCVVVTQTDSGLCHGNDECVKHIEKMEYNGGFMPYNYIISTDGIGYEYLGTNPNDYIVDRNAIVLAFIGNYTYSPPSRNQIVVARWIIDELVKNNHLARNYTILGKDKNELKYITATPSSLNINVDKLMYVVLTRMFANFTEAIVHM